MKILITGGSGFIGSHIMKLYQDRVDEIGVLDNLRTGYRHNLVGLRHAFIEGSITNRELVKKALEGVDYIFHPAALVTVPESMAKPGECVDINIHGLLNVFGPRQDPKGAYAAAVPIFIYVKDIAGALAFAVESPGFIGVFSKPQSDRFADSNTKYW